MKQRRNRTVAAVVAAAVLLSVRTSAGPSISANSVVLMDAASGRILWEKDAHTPSLIASTTKIMTGLLIAEQCELEEKVIVPEEAVGIEGSSMGLEAGETLTVEELLYGLLLQSGNDAAVALALHCDGSIPAFADRMNGRAAALHLEETHFVNPHGLDAENHYGTAYNLAVLACSAMDNPVFHRIVSTRTIRFGTRTLINHNKLLWQYEGAVGVKTGYTKAAGRILVSCAERGGRRLVAVTINAPDDWRDHQKLLDYGFSAYEDRTLCTAEEILAEHPVLFGAASIGTVWTGKTITYPVTEAEQISFQLELPDFVYAPVWAGEQAGSLIVMVNGTEVKRFPLYWRETILEGS